MRIDENGDMFITIKGFTETKEICIANIAAVKLNVQYDRCDVEGYLEELEQEFVAPVGPPHDRNRTAVNMSCLLYALGVENPWKLINTIDKYCINIINQYDKPRIKEAFERVEPYLSSWNNNGCVIDFMITY